MTNNDQEAREMVLAENEPWIREYVAEHGRLPHGIAMRLPDVEALLSTALSRSREAREQAIEECAKKADDFNAFLKTGERLTFHDLAVELRALIPLLSETKG